MLGENGFDSTGFDSAGFDSAGCDSAGFESVAGGGATGAVGFAAGVLGVAFAGDISASGGSSGERSDGGRPLR